jgi:hypothetical protein
LQVALQVAFTDAKLRRGSVVDQKQIAVLILNRDA